ncbi:MAG: YceD family protein [Chloroflexota bacterium]
MIQIRIHGIKDGSQEIDLKAPASEIDGIFEEFFGDIEIKGVLRKIGKRYSIDATASCMARLVCDISLESYEEKIEAPIKLAYLADTNLYTMRMESPEAEAEAHVIHEDDQYIDISDEVREQLAVRLPMKRISPKLRDKEFRELYPDIAAENEKAAEEMADERWKKLKNVKLN